MSNSIMDPRHVKIATVYENIIKMFGYRKYVVQGRLTGDAIIKEFESVGFIKIMGRAPNGKDVVATYFSTGNSRFTKSNQLRSFLEKLRGKIVLLITADKPTSYTTGVMKEQSEYTDIEYIVDTVFNIELPKHHLVPKHEIITREQFEAELKYHYVKPSQLQKIDVNDPMAIWLGGKVDDIFKITRTSENSGVSYGYRHCIRR